VCSVQVTIDKFRKIINGMKLGYGDDNIATLVHFYDQDHSGKVLYKLFVEDMAPLVSAGVEVKDLATDASAEKSYYPDNYVPYADAAGGGRQLPELDSVVFAPVGDGAAPSMKAGKGVRVRGRSQAPAGSSLRRVISLVVVDSGMMSRCGVLNVRQVANRLLVSLSSTGYAYLQSQRSHT
jgi:hypothetical protein